MSHDHFRDSVINAVGAGLSALGAISARQEQFDFWFRQMGTGVAITAGLITITRIMSPTHFARLQDWLKKLFSK